MIVGVVLTLLLLLAGSARAHEANPLLRGLQNRPLPFAIVKMGAASAMAYSLCRLHRSHPTLALVIGVVGTAVSTSIAVHNDRLLRRH